MPRRAQGPMHEWMLRNDRVYALRHATPSMVRHKMLMSPRMMPSQAGGGGGSGTLSGSVTLTGAGTAVVGGFVEVLNGTSQLAVGAVDGSGNYSIAGVPAGTWDAKYHNTTHSIGPSEPDTRPVTITSGNTTSQNFVAQVAVFYDNFQNYTTAQLLAGTGGSSFFTNVGGRDITVNQLGGTIVIEAGTGPFGGKAVRFDWAADPWDHVSPIGGVSTGYCGANAKNVSLQPRFNPLPGTLSTLYFRWTDKVSTGFQHGSQNCSGVAGLAYKNFLVELELGTPHARFGTYLGGNNATGIASYVTMDMADNDTPSHVSQPSSLNSSIASNTWNTWVLGITGISTTTTVMRLWKNAVLQQTLDHDGADGATGNTSRVFPGTALTNFAVTMEMGANLNNGPESAMSRWWSELGAYTTRPSLLSQAST